MSAVLAKQTPTVRWLLRQGADPRLKDAEGYSALMLAVREGATGAVAELAPYHRDSLDSAILLAALVGQAEAIDTLTNYGASVYARMEDGRTPLMIAAENGHKNAVELLLDIGASRFSTDAAGRTAADIANEARSPGNRLAHPARTQARGTGVGVHRRSGSGDGHLRRCGGGRG